MSTPLSFLFSNFKLLSPQEELKERSFCIQKEVLYPILFIISSLKERTSLSERLVRQSSQEKQALIRNHSSLEKPLTQSVLPKDLNILLHLLGQIHADPLIGKSCLENLPLLEAQRAFTQYIKSIKNDPGIMEPLSQIQQIIEEVSLLPKQMRESEKLHQEKINKKSKELETQAQNVSALERECREISYKISNLQWTLDQNGKNDYWYDTSLQKEQKRLAEAELKTMEEQVRGAERVKIRINSELYALKKEKVTIFPLYKLAQTVMNDVYKLECGKSYFMEGGRIQGGMEHPVLVEFVKIDSNHYDLFVYLPGKEAGQYRTLLYQEGKNWERPIIHYAKIPSTELFFNEQQEIQCDFFQALLEIKALRKQCSAEYVALHLFGHLQKYRITDSKGLESCFMSTAHSHSDSWRAMKVILYRFAGKESAKSTIDEIKYLSLIEGYQLCKEELKKDTPLGESLRLLLKFGSQNLLTTLVKKDRLHEASIQATALHLFDIIEKIEKTILAERLKSISDFSLDPLKTDTKKESRALSIKEAKKLCRLPKQNPRKFSPTAVRLF